jgi:subtilisin family serine protease
VYVVDGGLPAAFGSGFCASCDDQPHASMVASRIVDPVVGIARGARLVDVDVVDGPRGSTEQLRQGLDWIAAQPPGIVTMSLTVVDEKTGQELVYPDEQSCAHDDPVLAAAVEKLVARKFVVVAATGNADHRNRIGLPACLPGVVSVSGHAVNGERVGNRAAPSFLDLVAPALNLELATDKGYLCDGGTSFAAPGVAAALALLSSTPSDQALSALCQQAIDNPTNGCGSAGTGDRILAIDCAWQHLHP